MHSQKLNSNDIARERSIGITAHTISCSDVGACVELSLSDLPTKQQCNAQLKAFKSMPSPPLSPFRCRSNALAAAHDLQRAFVEFTFEEDGEEEQVEEEAGKGGEVKKKMKIFCVEVNLKCVDE